MKAQNHSLFVGAIFALGCRPTLEDDPSRVTEARVLAVRIEPPEANPGDGVTAQALVGSATGTVAAPAVAWATCDTPKSPAENGIVNPWCLTERGKPEGNGGSVTFALPEDGCALFGPDTPPGSFRPRDPDATGGYFQPLRLILDGVRSIALERIECDLPDAPFEAALELRARYVPNRNPKIASLTAFVGAAATPLDAIPVGTDVRFEIRGNAGDAETYVVFDPVSRQVATRREALSVSWYTTAGEFDVEETGGASDAAAPVADDEWRAPSAPGTAHFWAVLRDSRGGLDFTAWDGVVIP